MLKTCWMCGLLLVLCCSVATAQPPAPGARPEELIDGVFTIANNTSPVEAGEYWLGVWCAPVPPPLRAQLNLPEKQGVLVEGVAPESPAAKAGLTQYDVLLRAGEKPLAKPRELVEAVEAAKDGKLKIELIRGGKPKTVEVTPAKRPEKSRRPEPPPGSADWDTMNKWIEGEGIWSGREPNGPWPPMRYRFFHPGAILPHDMLAPPPLPPNMSVVVSKEGDQPAKIAVKRGDEKWEVTEKELDKLPADVRPHVERMLGRGPLGVVGGVRTFDFVPDVAPPEPPHRHGPASWEGRIEKRLDEMGARVDRLMRRMEEMVDGPGHHEAPQKPAEKNKEK